MNMGDLFIFWDLQFLRWDLSLVWLEFTPRYFTLFVAIVKGVVSLISFSACLSFVYRKAIDLFELILYPATSLKLFIRLRSNPIKKWGSELNKDFSPEEYRMAEKHLKKCSTSLIIGEIQIKTTPRFHLTPVRMAKMKIQVTADAGEDMDKEEHSSIVGGIASLYNHSGNQSCCSSENWT